MPGKFFSMNLGKVRKFRPFKIDYSRVRLLEHVDKSKKKPLTFKDFRRRFPLGALQTTPVRRPNFPADLGYLKDYSRRHFPKGRMLVLVNDSLYSSIAASITQYVKDVAADGYYAMVYRVIGGDPAALRKFIIDQRPLVGALMVGNLPVAWFEMADDFDGSAEFPCDLFYMDLNGSWNDPDGDGKYSEHPTNVAPEIWVGRLWTPTRDGNDADLIKDYFSRNHRFRKGRLSCSNLALAFVDDDWTGFDDCAFDSMFPAANIEVITDTAATNGPRYKEEINVKRAWAQVCAHSSPNGHSFRTPSGADWIPNTYLRDVDPPDAYFYNLFACSNACFTSADYMGGWYIFDKADERACRGLAAVGSTKTGSMLGFENFYGPMGDGKLLGESYVQWWDSLGAHELDDRRWFYGMTLLGDPTINWWSGIVPRLYRPIDGDVFDHYPRVLKLRWLPVDVAGALYRVEVDAFGAKAAGKWSAEVGSHWFTSRFLRGTEFEHTFVGKQRGRWRVQAKVNGVVGPWSDWRYFQFTR